jgi:hypothetical protein
MSLKAFGDFTIACWAMRKLGTGAIHYPLIYGDHLAEIYAALESVPVTKCLYHGEGGVPALFDIKKRGWLLGVNSAFHLRELLQSLDLQFKTTLVFDRVGLRERFIAGSRAVCSLPEAENIYLAYSQLFKLQIPLPRMSLARESRCSLVHVGIFPGSRIQAKTLLRGVVDHLIDVCLRCGKEPVLFVLDGEPCELPMKRVEVVTLPRRFASMANAVRSVDAVISADSLPAHMAEYFNRPVFVVSPKPNPYWLPLSCLSEHWWALFDESGATEDSLSRFLSLGVE